LADRSGSKRKPDVRSWNIPVVQSSVQGRPVGFRIGEVQVDREMSEEQPDISQSIRSGTGEMEDSPPSRVLSIDVKCRRRGQ